MKTLIVEPLSQAAFARFGDVLDTGRDDHPAYPINDGFTQRHHALSSVEAKGDGVIISIFETSSFGLPLTVKMLERHPFGSQSFQPLSGEAYLVLVGDPVESLKPENLHLFLATKDQGVNYRKNTWHHPVLGLHKVCDFLVVDRLGDGRNCEEIYFGDNVNIEITL